MKWNVDLGLTFVSCRGIGKAGAIILQNTQAWYGMALECVGWQGNGHEIEQNLTNASGVASKYSTAMPRWVMKRFVSDLYNVVLYSKEVVADAWTPPPPWRPHAGIKATVGVICWGACTRNCSTRL